MNKERLLELAAALEDGTYKELGIRFNMDHWIEPRKRGRGQCGSTSCIGGTTLLMFDQDNVQKQKVTTFDPERQEEVKVETLQWVGRGSIHDNHPGEAKARKLLGLDKKTADKLFYPYQLDRDDEDRNFDWENITPKQAAQVIRHLVDTGKVDWTVIL